MLSEKSRECTVWVKSVQKNEEGETQIFETRNKGRLSGREGVLYVLYEENGEETQGSAPVMSVKNLLKIEKDPLRASLKKSGAVSWRMTFEQGKGSEAAYETPYGTLRTGVWTTSVTLEMEQKKTSLQLLYTLFIQGEKQADCRLELEIEPCYFT